MPPNNSLDRSAGSVFRIKPGAAKVEGIRAAPVKSDVRHLYLHLPVMKKRIQFYLIVAGVIVMFDAVASAASRTLIVDYTKLSLVSYILYIAMGYLGCKSFDLLSGIAAGFVAGLSDSTIGWFLSSAIGPYIPFAQPKYTPLMVFVVIIMVSVAGALFGLVGALLSKIVNRDSRFADA